MKNIPQVNLGIVAVSRDCFPIELSRKRRERVVDECRTKDIPITEVGTVVENERDSLRALAELREKNINALVIYLGNFGPEGLKGSRLVWLDRCGHWPWIEQPAALEKALFDFLFR